MNLFDPGHELGEAGVTFESSGDFVCGIIGNEQS